LGRGNVPQSRHWRWENEGTDCIWGVPCPANQVRGAGRVQCGAPSINTFLKATECSFLHLYADALSSSNSISCHIWFTRLRFAQREPCLLAAYWPSLQLSVVDRSLK